MSSVAVTWELIVCYARFVSNINERTLRKRLGDIKSFEAKGISTWDTKI